MGRSTLGLRVACVQAYVGLREATYRPIRRPAYG